MNYLKCPYCKKDTRDDLPHCDWCLCTFPPGTARPDGSAFESSDWLGELEAVLVRVGAVRDAVPTECPEPTRDLLACAENDLRAVLRAERRIAEAWDAYVETYHSPAPKRRIRALRRKWLDLEGEYAAAKSATDPNSATPRERASDERKENQ